MKWLAIALVIAGCASWEELRADDVRSGRASIEGKHIEVATRTQSVEVGSAKLANGHVIGRTLDGAQVDVSLDDVVRLRVMTKDEALTAFLWVVLAVVVVAGVIFVMLLSKITPSG